MPRYYFHIREGDKFERDPEGSDHDSPEEARQAALAAAREMVAEAALRDELIDGRMFEVADEAGTVVDIVTFQSVIRI